jgi:hypothetical protein
MHLNLYLLISVFARTIFALSPSEIIGSLDTLTVAANKITPLLNEIVADTKSQDILVCFFILARYVSEVLCRRARSSSTNSPPIMSPLRIWWFVRAALCMIII